MVWPLLGVRDALYDTISSFTGNGLPDCASNTSSQLNWVYCVDTFWASSRMVRSAVRPVCSSGGRVGGGEPWLRCCAREAEAEAVVGWPGAARGPESARRSLLPDGKRLSAHLGGIAGAVGQRSLHVRNLGNVGGIGGLRRRRRWRPGWGLDVPDRLKVCVVGIGLLPSAGGHSCQPADQSGGMQSMSNCRVRRQEYS